MHGGLRAGVCRGWSSTISTVPPAVSPGRAVCARLSTPYPLRSRILRDVSDRSLEVPLFGKTAMCPFGIAPSFDFDRKESRAKADWTTLKRLRDAWRGNLVVKGVLDPEDARQLCAAGVDAIQVSNHGARQLESAVPAIQALADIRVEIGTKMPVFFDSGLRSGEDVIKAYALGADFVFLGWILQFAIAAAGEEGLHRLWRVLCAETSIAMAQVGIVQLAQGEGAPTGDALGVHRST